MINRRPKSRTGGLRDLATFGSKTATSNEGMSRPDVFFYALALRTPLFPGQCSPLLEAACYFRAGWSCGDNGGAKRHRSLPCHTHPSRPFINLLEMIGLSSPHISPTRWHWLAASFLPPHPLSLGQSACLATSYPHLLSSFLPLHSSPSLHRHRISLKPSSQSVVETGGARDSPERVSASSAVMSPA